MITRVDPLLARAWSTLGSELVSQAIRSNVSESDLQVILRSLPHNAHLLPVFQDVLTGIWRYDFGNPARETLAIGAHTFPEVERLLDALVCAYERMTTHDFRHWNTRLWESSQHQSMLEELAPILCLQSNVGVTPNVTGKSSGGSSAHDIDWELDIPSFQEKRFLLEVKLRHGDLSTHLEEIVASALGLVHAPRTDPENLFANIAHKFENNDPCDVLQGAWVATWIKPERSAINTAFNRLPECVHFVLIVPPGVKQRSAYLLSRDSPDISRTQILEIFGLHHDPSLLFESETDAY